MAKAKAGVEKQDDAKTAVIEEGTLIKSHGPSDVKNGAEILRYTFEDGRKTPLDIQTGMILKVGEDIDPEDAERLLALDVWEFEKVEEE